MQPALAIDGVPSARLLRTLAAIVELTNVLGRPPTYHRLSMRLSLYHRTVVRHVFRLQDIGLVQMATRPRRVLQPTARGRQWLEWLERTNS